MIKICIDAGHGGSDRANKGPTGYIEADGVLDIALKLRDELLATGAFEVKLTRDKDMTLGIRERGHIAAEWGADIFISEHTNATGFKKNSTVRGTDVYSSVDLNDDGFAAEMAKAISEAIGTKNNGAKKWESEIHPGEDYLGVIDAAQDAGVKHILLIESAFHDHPDDEKLLKDPEKRTSIAKAQAKTICKFCEVKYPTKTEPITVLIDGKPLEMDVDPININGRVMVPVRFIAQKLGCTVNWDKKSNTVLIETNR